MGDCCLLTLGGPQQLIVVTGGWGRGRGFTRWLIAVTMGGGPPGDFHCHHLASKANFRGTWALSVPPYQSKHSLSGGHQGSLGGTCPPPIASYALPVLSYMSCTPLYWRKRSFHKDRSSAGPRHFDFWMAHSVFMLLSNYMSWRCLYFSFHLIFLVLYSLSSCFFCISEALNGHCGDEVYKALKSIFHNNKQEQILGFPTGILYIFFFLLLMFAVPFYSNYSQWYR